MKNENPQPFYTTEQTTHTDFFYGDIASFLDRYTPQYSTVWFFIDDALKSNPKLQHIENAVFLPSGETQKSLLALEEILASFFTKNIDKSSLIVAVGGGAMSDIIGLATSLYHRGVPLAIMPTTFLSMVDASIGGKNAINFHHHKNQIGTIYQPKIICVDIDILDDLPRAEYVQGMGEVIKYSITLDSEMYDVIANNDIDALMADKELKNYLISKSIKHKSQIVSRDVNDNHGRKVLNFGHTIGHAIEATYGLPHGSSVALGMIFSLRFSEYYLGLSSEITDSFISVLKRYDLPTHIDLNKETIVEAIKKDKKKSGDNISFVFVDDIGHSIIKNISYNELSDFVYKNDDTL